ncbi:MAG TPA: ABC transporter permease [Candidatus Polarisedimenticolaceae bacterium]|nr:ABC transporter permease [Candidatus Polarisedimenticolaceae bacterium]
MLAWLRQVAAVSTMNLRAVLQRLGPSVTTVLGVAGVVGVFVAVLSIGEGFRKTLDVAGRPDVALVLRTGSSSEMMSVLARDATQLVAQAPGVLHDERGPLASAELFVVIDVPKRATGTAANVPLRGVQGQAAGVRGTVRLVEGRWFETGKNEIVAGRGAAREFSGLTLGSTHRWGENDWQVVGIFEADGALWESELWCDAAVLQPAYRRGDSFQSVIVRLESPDSFNRFKDALTQDPRLDVDVRREAEYYAEQSRVLVGIIRGLGTLIAAMMAIGAVFGGLLTMYSAVAARSREIATLRALGFGAGPVVVSVLAESLLLALAGGLLGGIVAYLGFDGFTTSTMNFQSFSQVAFAFAVTPGLIASGMVIALIVGLVGGLLPAIRAARLPVTTALREP